MDVALLCRLFFTTGAIVAIGGTLVPSFQQKIMIYGSRKRNISNAARPPPKNVIEQMFEFISSVQVPHSYFTHYYVVSVISSLFWGYQIAQHGRAVQLLASLSKYGNTSMTVNQVVLAWAMMLFQGSRRLYESITLRTPSQSRMWIGLLIIGELHYLCSGVSVWIDGIQAIDVKNPLSRLDFSTPSPKTTIALLLFFLASWVQNKCHNHLASLRKYSLPRHPFFSKIVCPHYTSECLIYLALAIVSAPRGRTLNASVSAGLLFVTSNLAVTADSTWQWYSEKFGRDAVLHRWRMMPFVY